MSKPIPKNQRANMLAKLAYCQVLAEESAGFFQIQRELSTREKAQLAGMLARLGQKTQETLVLGSLIIKEL